MTALSSFPYTFTNELNMQCHFLEQCVASGHLAYVDLALARHLLSGYPSCSEAAAALLCHLSASARYGHLCIDLSSKQIHPPIAEIWQQRDAQTLDLDHNNINDLQPLERMINQGAEELPKALFTDIPLAANLHHPVATPLCRLGDKFYLQRYWHYETQFLYHYKRHISLLPTIQIQQSAIDLALQACLEKRPLLPAQIAAIRAGCKNCLTVICGGPGTGKTHTAGQLIRIVWESLPAEERSNYHICLAAPTGKAAANLQKSLQAAAEGILSLQNLPTATLHSLLGQRSRHKRASPDNPLEADLLIVDEASMIDVQLMANLFSALKPGSRLIMLGDNHQLPAVEAGSLFADLIVIASQPAQSLVNRLTHCLRAELQVIVDFATAINKGEIANCQKLLTPPAAGERSGIVYCHLGDRGLASSRVGQLIDYAVPHYALPSPSAAPTELLTHFNRFRILSPLRKGPFGVEEINRRLFTALLQCSSRGGPFIAPILITRNERSLALNNGEVGILVNLRSHGQADLQPYELAPGDYALFPSSDGQSVRRVPALLLPPFEYAYCMSVHKSQGSEFDKVLLLLPPGSELFGRELLYTGVTRARQALELWSDNSTLKQTLEHQNRRLSGIVDRQHCAAAALL
jgi:exodeoxyribonuclease V alpha subunit